MAERVFVRPGVGPDGAPFVTRNPLTGKPLLAQGDWVERDRTTRRRLRDGDWVEAVAPAAEPSDQPAPEVIVEPITETER